MRDYLVLVWELAKSDFKLRYVKARLGLLWAILLPFVTFSVLYVVFSWVTGWGGQQNYVFSLLLGIILWSFFFDATSSSIQNIIGKRALIRNVAFPVSAVTTAACFASFVILVINTLIFLGALLFSGAVATPTWLLITPILLGFFLVTLGISQIISAVNVVYRDIQHVWLAVLQLGFFLSPIIYPVSAVPAQYQRWYLMNPIALVIRESRASLLDESFSTAAITILVLGGLVIAILGGLLQHRLQFTIREEL